HCHDGVGARRRTLDGCHQTHSTLRSNLVDQLDSHHHLPPCGEPAADRCNVAPPKQRHPRQSAFACSIEGRARASRAVVHDPSEAITIELAFTAYRLHETSSAAA